MTLRRMSSFDCLKGVSCLAIVALHYVNTTSSSFLAAAQALTRFAVPVFFSISGYFLLSGNRIDSRKTVIKIRRLIVLTLWSSLFHALYIACSNIVFHPGWSARAFASEWINTEKLVLLLVQNSPFVYSHHWFLFALIDCYLFSLLFFRGAGNRKWIYLLTPALLAAYIFLQEWRTFLGWPLTFTLPYTNIAVTTHNLFIFRALPFFLFGVILREQRDKVTQWPIRRSVLLMLAVFGGAIAVCERLYIASTQYFMGSCLSAAALLILCIKEPDMHYPRLRYIGQNLSMSIYVIHIVVLQVLDGIADKLHWHESTVYIWFKLPLALLVCLLSAEVIHRCSCLISKHRAA